MNHQSSALRTSSLLRSLPLGALLLLSAPLLRAQPIPVEGVVADEQGCPLAGATVELKPLLAKAEVARLLLAGKGDLPAAASARTDGAGRFLLQAPGPGMWIALASAPGKAALQRELVPLLEPMSLGEARLPAAEAVIQATPLELLAFGGAGTQETYGWHVAGARSLTAAEEKAVPPADPTRISGRAVEAAGRHPIAGAFVWVPSDPGGAVRTDADGGYALVLTVPAEGVLAAAAEGTVVVAEAYGSEGCEAALQGDLAGPTFRLQASATLRGTVVDEKGAPIGGARVSIFPSGYFGRERLWKSMDDRTADDGSFRLRLGADQAFRLGVTYPGRRAVMLPLDGLRAGKPREELRVVLPAARRLVLRVTGGEGQPLAGVQATVFPSPRGDMTEEEALDYLDAPYGGLSDGAGRLTVGKVPSPFFDLLLVAAGFAPLVQARVESPRDAPDPELDLGTIALQPGLTLRGRVEDPSGRPIAGASIRCHLIYDQLGWPDAQPGSRPRIHSGADGSFEIRDLGSDMRAHLTVEREGYETTQVTTVTLPDGQIEQVVLRPTSPLRDAVPEVSIPAGSVGRIEPPRSP